MEKTSVAGGLVSIFALLRAGLDTVLSCDQLHSSQTSVQEVVGGADICNTQVTRALNLMRTRKEGVGDPGRKLTTGNEYQQLTAQL